MVITFFVGSKSVVMLPEPVQGIGDNSLTAARSALTVAEKLKHIPQPVVLTDTHESAKLVRRAAEQKQRELVRTAKSNGTPFFLQPEDVRYKH